MESRYSESMSHKTERKDFIDECSLSMENELFGCWLHGYLHVRKFIDLMLNFYSFLYALLGNNNNKLNSLYLLEINNKRR